MAKQSNQSTAKSGAQYPPWLIQTKLRPNVVSGKHLTRFSLDRFIEGTDPKLILVHAPAGYGKTSTMMQLHRDLITNGKKAAWLSLDEQDADPIQFFCYFVASCLDAGSIIDFTLPPHPQVLASSSLDYLMDTVLSALERNAPPDYIFLDDFHRAENDATSQLVRRLLSGLEETTIVLSSRTFPDEIETASLRAQGRVTEFTQKELQFDVSEVDAYLGNLLPANIREQSCADLIERTEGWPIALQAVRQLIKSGNSAEDALQTVSGRSRLLSDYFIEQVFNTLSPEEQKLLVSTAILERVNGDLADAVCNTNNAWALLDKLEKNDVFIESIDPERQWYRFHKLFAEFIAERARRGFDVEISDLAGRASKWFRDNDYPTEALQYAMQSENTSLIAETLAGLGGWRQSMMGNLAGVQQAVQLLPEETLRSFPNVWMADIYGMLKVGDYETAAVELKALRERYSKEIEDDVTMRNDLGLLDALLVGYRDEFHHLEEMIEFLETVGPTVARDDDYFQAMRFNSLCFFYYRRGEFENAISAGETAIHYYQKGGSVYGETFIYFHQCYIYYVQGRLRDANATLEQGLELSKTHFGANSDLYAIGAAFAALLAYEENDLGRAEKFLNVALPLIEQSDAWTEVYLVAYTAGLSIAATRKDWDGVSRVDQRAVSTANSRQLRRVAQFADACHQDFLLRARVDEDQLNNRQLSKKPDANILELDGFHRITAHGRYLLRQKKFQDAISFLSEQAAITRERQLNRPLMTISLLSALAHQGNNDIDAASECFNEFLGCAMFEGFKRPIIDEGPAILDLIQDIEKNASLQRHNRLRDSFLAAVAAEINAEHKPEESGEGLLSEREQAVLRCLLHGRTNKEVSEALGISQNTVKFHLKNLFQKIGVSSRQEAVRIALRDQLI